MTLSFQLKSSARSELLGYALEHKLGAYAEAERSASDYGRRYW
jgi:hypothetical protein